MFDRELDWLDGLILLCGLAYILWQLLRSERTDPSESALASELEELPRWSGSAIFGSLRIDRTARRSTAFSLCGNRDRHRAWHQQYVIGLTIVAVGTSLPGLQPLAALRAIQTSPSATLLARIS